MAKKPKIISNFAPLKKLTQVLKVQPNAQLGILGDQATAVRQQTTDEAGNVIETDKTNADIGLEAEFGVRSRGVPKRSFLREPIQEKFHSAVVKAQKPLTEAMEAMDIKGFYTLLGIVGEGVVQEAFDTRGFGKWAPNAQRTIIMKGSDSPLIDSSQLRKSITSDVKRK